MTYGGKFGGAGRDPEIPKAERLQVGPAHMTELDLHATQRLLSALLEHHLCVANTPRVLNLGVEHFGAARVLSLVCRSCSKTHHIIDAY